MSGFSVGDRVIWSVPSKNIDFPGFHAFYLSRVIEQLGGKDIEGIVVSLDTPSSFMHVAVVGVSFEALKAEKLGHDCEGSCDFYSGQWILPEHLRHIDAYKFNKAYFCENLGALLSGGSHHDA